MSIISNQLKNVTKKANFSGLAKGKSLFSGAKGSSSIFDGMKNGLSGKGLDAFKNGGKLNLFDNNSFGNILNSGIGSDSGSSLFQNGLSSLMGNSSGSSSGMDMSSFSSILSTFMQAMQSVLQSLGSSSSGSGGSQGWGDSSASSSTSPYSSGGYSDAGMGNSGDSSIGGTSGTQQTSGTSNSSNNNASSSYNTADGNIKSLLDVASGEVGQREKGSTNKGEAVRKYGRGDQGYAWCANFASWCLEEGLGKNNPMKRTSSCQNIVGQAKKQNAWASRKSGYSPQAGDLILFDWNHNGSAQHVGIVEKVEDGKVYTIEGNSSDAVKRRSYSLSSKDVLGYYQVGKAMNS